MNKSVSACGPVAVRAIASRFARRRAARATSSALAALVHLNRGLPRRLRLGARAGVFGARVLVAPFAQFVGVALKMRVHVTRHQLIAALGCGPVRPVVREQEDAAEAAV